MNPLRKASILIVSLALSHPCAIVAAEVGGMRKLPTLSQASAGN